VKFKLLCIETADELRKQQEAYLDGITNNEKVILPILQEENKLDNNYPILVNLTEDREDPLVIRCAGDEYILVEYGEMEIELRLRIRVHALMELVKEDKRIPVIDVTPGIRSIQIHIDSTKMSIKSLAQIIVELDNKIGDLSSFKVKSRIIKMPLSWNDYNAQLAVERYYQNVRPNAPWCPSNIEFIRRINGLDSTEKVREILYSATYMVLGLGDVYLGAPVCIPLDPRQRLVTTKYNPARTWTPENAVGIGGAYMGIYGMEGPGGYQLVGRTIQTWNPIRSTKSFEKGKPWLLNFFDQIQFYPVSADELLRLREDFLRGRYEVEVKETVFDFGEYLEYLKLINEETKAFKKHQVDSFNTEKNMWKEKGLDEFVSEHQEAERKEIEIPEGLIAVRSNMPASVWKILIKPGDKVKKGDVLVVEESMKMEFEQVAPCDGEIIEIYVKETEEVVGGQLLVTIG
ncbi:MAG: carboxyltransferase domain-containing protein, partial [Ruminiclostridium sp.]